MGGAVTGPASSTDTAIARWNGTSGTEIEDSVVTVDGSGNLGGVAAINDGATATTQAFGDNSDRLATDEFVIGLIDETYTARSVGFTSVGPRLGKQKGYYTCPAAGAIDGWSFAVDAGTATVKVWKVAAGTASPTSADSISTSGVSISSGTAIQSTTLTDFTTTVVNADDIFAFELTAFSGCNEITFQLEILEYVQY
jgi:hypothetical protein